MAKLNITKQQIQAVEIQTRNQCNNPLWRQYRSVRLTAIMFGPVLKCIAGHRKPPPSLLKQEFVRPRWPYDMRPSARAEKYIRDAGPLAKTEVFLFWMFARKTVLL